MTDPRSFVERQGRGLKALLWVIAALVSALPLITMVVAAVTPSGGLSVASLMKLTAPDVQRAAINTLATACGSCVLSVALGLSLALVLAITPIRAKRIIAGLFVFSLMISPQVAALAFKTLAGPASPLLNLLGLAPPAGSRNPMLGACGIVFVMGIHHAPLAALTLAPGLAAIPRSLIEAAILDGATPATLVWRIVLPLIRWHLIAAALLVFVSGAGNFGIPALLGLPVGYATLPTLVYQMLAAFGPGRIGDAAAISLILALICGVAVLATLLIQPQEAARLEADETMPTFWRLGRSRMLVEALVWVFIACTVVLPLVSLVATSLLPTYGIRLSLKVITLASYNEVLFHQALTLRAFRNSMVLAGGAAFSLGVLSLLLAYALDRLRPTTKAIAGALIELPYALPGVVLAMACILLFVRPLPILGVSIYGTIWILFFAYLVRFLPLALKPTAAAMAMMSRDQEEAATLCGAGLGQRVYHIVGPTLLAPATAGALMVFLLAFNELTVSALLWSSGTETLGVALLSLEDAGLSTASAALAVTATGVVAALMLVFDGLAPWLPWNALPWRVLSLGNRDRH